MSYEREMEWAHLVLLHALVREPGVLHRPLLEPRADVVLGRDLEHLLRFGRVADVRDTQI